MIVPQKYTILLLLAVIVTATVLTFSPCLSNGFVGIVDDNSHLCQNPAVTQLSWMQCKTVVAASHIGLYMPLVLLSYAVEFHFFGLDPAVYHATNLVLHVSNALLVYWLFLLLSGRRSVAVIVAALFALHPLHVESVAWISERKDVLYAFFYLLSAILYVRFLQSNRRWFYVLSLCLFLLSLGSKAMAVSLPLLLFAFDWFRGRKIDSRNLLEKIPFVLLAVADAVVSVAAQYGYSHRSLALLPGALVHKAWTIPYSFVFYLHKIFVPAGLSCYYVFPSGQAKLPAAISAVIGCALVLVVSFVTLRRTRKISFGILFYGLTIFPVLNIIPFGLETVADRYTYLPALGIFFLIAVCFMRVYDAAARPFVRGLLLGGAVALGICTAAVARDRCAVWRNDVVLLRDALAKSGPQAPVYRALGEAYKEREEYDRAVVCLRQAITLRNEDGTYYRCLADLYYARGDYRQALPLYRQAYRLDPRDNDSVAMLLDTLDRLGDFAAEQTLFDTVIRDHTVSTDVLVRRGICYARRGERRSAESMFRQALQHDPECANACYNLGILYLDGGEKEKALTTFEQAAAQGSMSRELYNNIGTLAMERGADDRAFRAFRQSLRIDPRFAPTYYNLGNLYLKLCRYPAAIKNYGTAAALMGPNEDPALLFNSGIAYVHVQEYEKALQQFERVQRIAGASPGVDDAIARLRRHIDHRL